jgi:flagellar basal body-associated protein FliL
VNPSDGSQPQHDQQFPPPQGPGAWPPPPSYYPVPQPKSHRSLWIALAVAVCVVVAAATVAAVYLFTRKPDITALTESMLIPESAFPSLPDGEFSREAVSDSDDEAAADVTPVECEFMANYPSADQITRAQVSSADDTFVMTLRINREWPDLRAVLDDCDGRSIEYGGTKATVASVDAPDLPDWAIGVELKDENPDAGSFLYFSGYHRGLQIEALHSGRQSPSDVATLVEMLNAQVDRLADR